MDTSQIDLTQFGLKAKNELIPDLCVYPNTVKRKRRDVLRMLEMPLLAIEVVSPQQGIEEILAKFDAYFALGVKSCWLVVPSMEVLDIYSQPDQLPPVPPVAIHIQPLSGLGHLLTDVILGTINH